MLRHQDQPGAAQRLIIQAAARVEATGLTTTAQTAAYAQMLSTSSYTAARAGNRHQAPLDDRRARRADRRLPDRPTIRQIVTELPASHPRTPAYANSAAPPLNLHTGHKRPLSPGPSSPGP